MRKKLAAVPFILAFMFLFAGCGSSTVLTGTWLDEDENIYAFDGTDVLTIADKENVIGMSCTYELTPDNEDEKSLTGRIKIIITPQADKKTETEGTYKLEDDSTKLTITGDDGSVSVLTKAN